MDTGRSLWHRRVAETPDRPYLCWAGDTWTFGEVDDRMRRLAGGLRTLGVGLGDRVLVGMRNGSETLFVHHALRELGAVLVPLLPGLTFDELAFQINHSQAATLIADDSVADVVLPRVAECPGIHRTVIASVAAPPGTAALAELLAGPPLPPGPLEGYDDLSVWAILYTSGSTGKPKGVVLPAGSFVSAGLGYANRFGVGPDDNVFLALTMAHAVGALTVQSMAIHKGSRLTIVDRFSPSVLWEQVEESGGTVTILFPAQLNLLLETGGGPARGTSSLRLVITHQWIEAFRERFGVELGLCWGMTETGAASTGSDPGYANELGEAYVGRPMEGVEIGIFDDASQRLGPGETGEIRLGHPHVMHGYLDDPEATARTLRDGWIHTGDRGSLDEAGHLFFEGRIKNLIKRSGENISPEEVEVVLARQPGVAECLVFGVPDRIRTQEVAAVVVTRGDAAVDPAELTRLAGAELSRWKLPRYVALSPVPLPRLDNGKIDRQAVVRSVDLDACWDRER